MDTRLLEFLIQEEEEEEEDLLFLLAAIIAKEQSRPLQTLPAEEGFKHILVQRHLLKDETTFRNFFRVNVKQFDFILSHIERDIRKQSCGKVKRPIAPVIKLGLTLKFLATGENYKSLSRAFTISPGYISRIVREVLKVCSEKLPRICMPTPTQQHLLAIAKDFEDQWNLINCISAVDGKHLRIFRRGRKISQSYNCKDLYPVVLLALVDANYKFVMIDMDAYGSEGDSEIIEISNIGALITSEEFYPPPRKLEDLELPYVVVGDEAFKLSAHVMKPYSRDDARVDKKKAAFNYRLSQAKSVSENAFALLSQVFQIFYKPISVMPEVADYAVITACCLHNMLRDGFLEENNKSYFEVTNLEPLRDNLIPIAATGEFGNDEGFAVRERFSEYFNSNSSSVM